jgi:hypothetical protein
MNNILLGGYPRMHSCWHFHMIITITLQCSIPGNCNISGTAHGSILCGCSATDTRHMACKLLAIVILNVFNTEIKTDNGISCSEEPLSGMGREMCFATVLPTVNSKTICKMVNAFLQQKLVYSQCRVLNTRHMQVPNRGGGRVYICYIPMVFKPPKLFSCIVNHLIL